MVLFTNPRLCLEIQVPHFRKERTLPTVLVGYVLIRPDPGGRRVKDRVREESVAAFIPERIKKCIQAR